MTKELAEVKAELTAALASALREANTLRDAPGGYVVAFADDYTPMRLHEGRIQMLGRELWIAYSLDRARSVARELSRKGARVGVLVVALPVSEWATRRAAKLNELIALL